MQSSRLTTFFFVLFLFALGPAIASVWLGLQYLSDQREIGALRNAKLNREVLEQQLLKGQNSLHAVTPHADPHVGFVLNMHLQMTDLWAAEGDKYAINSLGLRGQPIAPKPAGTKRIVLVSDSWLFGWRLPDADKVEWALKGLLARYYPGLPLEVLTVAMPGWNVENAAAFLDDHADIISPDIMIWAINSNDLWDTAGVLPPGILSFKASRSSQWVCPETSFMDQRWQVPFVVDGWKKNIALMNAVQRTFGVPLMALFDHEYRDVVTMIRDVGKPEFEIFSTPNEFQSDRRWHVEYPNDSHPSKWASNLIAVDILARLASSGFLPKVMLEPEHQAIAEKGIAASQGVDPADLQRLLRGAGTPYPRAYERSSEPPKIQTTGITEDWKACPEGRLVMEPEGDGVEISFDDVKPMPNQLTCEARNTKTQASGVGTVQDGKASCSVIMPNDGLPVEMVWHFSRFACTGSQDCYAGRFKSLRSVQR